MCKKSREFPTRCVAFSNWKPLPSDRRIQRLCNDARQKKKIPFQLLFSPLFLFQPATLLHPRSPIAFYYFFPSPFSFSFFFSFFFLERGRRKQPKRTNSLCAVPPVAFCRAKLNHGQIAGQMKRWASFLSLFFNTGARARAHGRQETKGRVNDAEKRRESSRTGTTGLPEESSRDSEARAFVSGENLDFVSFAIRRRGNFRG